MAYTGNDSYERQIYDKLIEAGVSDRDANTMARIKANMDKDKDYEGLVREGPVTGFITWLRSKF